MPGIAVPLAQRLAATARAADRALDRRLAECGGNRTVWRVLRHLADEPVANQTDIARALGVTGATGEEHEHMLTSVFDPDEVGWLHLRLEQLERVARRVEEGGRPTDFERWMSGQ